MPVRLSSRPGVRAAIAAVAGIAAGSAGIGALTAVVLARRFGAREDERRTALPGDELLPDVDMQRDHAITIPVPPDQVWPWIAQLGRHRAGFYSFELLENLIGCDVEGASRVHPEWQRVQVGEELPLHPELALRIARVAPGRHLVATSLGGRAPNDPGFHMSWGFFLSRVALGEGVDGTRLQVRERYAVHRDGNRMLVRAVVPVSTVMTWRMLSRLKELAGRPR